MQTNLFQSADDIKIHVLCLLGRPCQEDCVVREGHVIGAMTFPDGPMIKKNISLEILNLDRNFESRSKISISTSRFPTKNPRWVARSKISFSLEIFNLARNLEFF